MWRDEKLRQRDEGVKDRPCLIILAVRVEGEATIVSVAPITHRKPPQNAKAVELPSRTKQRLGLDNVRSWIVTDDLNEFAWLGPDIRATGPGGPGQFAYGFVPREIFSAVKAAILAHITARGLRISRRRD